MRSVFFGAAAALLTASLAQAQLDEDLCANSGLDVVGPGVHAFDNTAAGTGPEGQAEVPCTFYGQIGVTNDIWFTYQVASAGSATIATCGSTVDTKIIAYAGGTPCPSGPSLTCNDDACGLQSSITLGPVACGETYLIQLGNFPGAASGTGTVTITETGSTPCPAPNVLNEDTGSIFTTIQEAIDDAATVNTHTLRMLNPTHTEGPGIVFSKSLTLVGMAGGGTTLFNGGDTGTSGDARAWIKTNTGTICTFSDLIFDGNGFKTWQGLRGCGDGTVSGCRFMDIQYEPSGPAYQGTGFVAINANWNIKDCDFDAMGRSGTFFFGSDSFACSVNGMTYTGKGAGDWLDYGMEVGAGAQVQVRNFDVVDCLGIASSDGSASAGAICTTFFAFGSRLSIDSSTFGNNTYGVAVGVNSNDGSFVNANFCDIVGNKFGVSNVGLFNLVDARFNFWGDATGPFDPIGAVPNDNDNCTLPNQNPLLDGVNADGLGDEVTDFVIYCEWLEILNGSVDVTRICSPNNATSTGKPATIIAGGSDSIAANDLFIGAIDLPPNQFGYFLASDNVGVIDLPAAGLSQGFFCLALGDNLGRYNGNVLNSGPGGAFGMEVDVNNVPIAALPNFIALMSGDTWYFQAWFRDVAAGPTPINSGNNFTDAICITFTD